MGYDCFSFWSLHTFFFYIFRKCELKGRIVEMVVGEERVGMVTVLNTASSFFLIMPHAAMYQ